MTVAWSRRRFTRTLTVALIFVATPLTALARNKVAFQASETADALRALFGDRPLKDSDDIDLRVPDIAEDGSIVPVTVSTEIPGVKSIYLLVEGNPNPLSARFNFLPGSIPEFKTRIKMGESSDVHAIVETQDALYRTTRNVKVTLGGCGG
jgi:sulfur-oxidizing protein SoxY